MKPNVSFFNQPIRSLQTMLRVIAEQDPRHETLVPDGIYGPATVSAISRFQRLHGIPVTGVTDQYTWEQIVAEYEPALVQITEAESLDILLNPGQVIRKGERHPNIYLVQAILAVLEESYSSIGSVSHTGILDEATSAAIGAFQALSGLSVTGNLDKQTWKALALHYPLAANLQNTDGNIYKL